MERGPVPVVRCSGEEKQGIRALSEGAGKYVALRLLDLVPVAVGAQLMSFVEDDEIPPRSFQLGSDLVPLGEVEFGDDP